ncbi:MAG: tetratricopeptide repeat protein, partial [Sandarakinorhabdus sp.]|nr:tetratricopeptide repeat protein [Sandarakinorhabdus sp.]
MAEPVMAISPADIGILQRAVGLLQANRGLEAEALLRTLPPGAQGHPDALYLRAVCAEKAGRVQEALTLFDAALRLAPGHAGIWNSRGNLLDRLGDQDGAMTSYRRAVAIVPGHFEAWLNLGIVGAAMKRWDDAEQALGRAGQLAPGDGRVPAVIGLLEQGRGRLDAAIAAYGSALAINPRDTRARHNLATALRTKGDLPAALAEIDAAIRDGMTSADTAAVRAHLLADLGQFDAAVAQYRAVIAAAPDHLDAQETLAQLLPQIGRGAEALDGYAAALGPSASRALWVAAINAARAAGDAAKLLRWADAAAAAQGPHLDWTLARIGALTLMGERDAALAAGLAADQNSGSVRNYLAYLYLQAGDLARAEAHALAATRLIPDSQSPWALLSIIWRLTGDAREAWLADYDRLVMVADLAVPDGWPDLPTFLAALTDVLTRLHLTIAAPAEQSLRGGTQTRGKLLDKTDPIIKALEHSLIATIEQCLAGLSPEPGHPFLGRLNGKIEMAGSWSVRLSSAGFHISH